MDGFLLSVTFYMIHCCLGADFLQVPTDVNATLATDTITFRCRTNSQATYWLVNGNPPPIAVEFGFTTEDGVKSLYLRVPVRETFNNSKIECVIDLPGGGKKRSAAFLRIQGLLEAVENLQAHPSRNTIHLTWIEPQSLDITGTEPDVWYHITVTKTTTSKSITQFSIPMDDSPQVIGSEYAYMESHPNPCNVYEFSVVPVNAIGEGKRASIIRSSFLEEPCSITAEDVILSPLLSLESCQVNLTIKFPVPYCPGKVPNSFQIYLQSIDNIMPMMYVHNAEDILLTSQTLHENTTICLSLITTELVWGEKYNILIEAENQVGRKNSTGNIEIYVPQRPHLSNASAKLTNDERVCITCTFKSAVNIETQENCTAELLSPVNALVLSTLHITALPLQSQLAEATDCFNTTLSEGNYTVEIYSELITLCRAVYSLEFTIQPSNDDIAKWENQTPATTDYELPTESDSFHPSNSGPSVHCSVTCITGTAIGAGIFFIASTLVVISVLLGRKLQSQGNRTDLKHTQIELTTNACYQPGSTVMASSNPCYSSAQPTSETNDTKYEEIPS